MNIALDMMGGDFAPLEAVKGAAAFIGEHPDTTLQLTLIGDETTINQHLLAHPIPAANYQIVPTSQVIEMNEHPTKALKEKRFFHRDRFSADGHG